MCLLTEKQIAIITNDVENEGINYSHLMIDLIDHVCCDIESHMNQGISFDQAYQLVRKEFGIKGLRHIQQDTLMLIDKNYRIMKNSMKLIGVLAMALMAFGALFKIMHWPFASVMLLISFFFTTYVFFPSLLYVIYKEVNQKKQTFVYILSFISGALFISSVQFKIMHWPFGNIAFFLGLGLVAYVLIPILIISQFNAAKYSKSVFLAGFLSLIILLTGLIFKMQHWPCASILLITGGVAFVFVFIPIFYVKEVRKSEKIRIDFLFGIIALTYFIILTFLLSLSRNENLLIELNYANNSYGQNSLYFEKSNNVLLKDSIAQSAMQLANQADLVCNKIEEIKVQIFQTHFKVIKDDAILLSKKNVFIKDSENDVNYLLPRYNLNSPLIGLKTDLEQFNQLYKSVVKDSILLNTNKLELFNTEKRIIGNDGMIKSWEDYHFEDQPAAAVLNTLTLWQYDIRLVENEVLNSLTNNSNKTI